MTNPFRTDIENKVKANPVMVYMRGTPTSPRCGFSARIVKVFKDLNVDFAFDDMDRDPELWEALAEMNNWPTSPQIFINGEFVGGCDIVCEMARNGDLQKMLATAK